jgi:hypothetical protein
LFKWLLPISPNTDLQSLDAVVESFGFEIDHFISSENQLFATDPATSNFEYNSRVSIAITRCNKDSRDFAIEARCSEPVPRKECALCAKKQKRFKKHLAKSSEARVMKKGWILTQRKMEYQLEKQALPPRRLPAQPGARKNTLCKEITYSCCSQCCAGGKHHRSPKLLSLLSNR